MTADPAPPPCHCPGARRMGRSDGVIHPHMRGCDGCHRDLRSYLWVVDGVHLCGRCRFGAGRRGVSVEVVPFGWPQHTERPPCQWGPCGHCREGKHESCQWVREPRAPRRPRPSPHTWILDQRGRVIFPTVRVYVSGTHETWICACHVAGHQGQGTQEGLW